jgi:hypothetical protein
MGVVAAFIVPLFLSTISSDLLSSGVTDRLKLFVFGGFCIVAAIGSRAFIHNISDAVLEKVRDARLEAAAAGEKAAQAAQEVDQVAEKVDQVGEEAVREAKDESRKAMDDLRVDVEETLVQRAAPEADATRSAQGQPPGELMSEGMSEPPVPSLDALAEQYDRIRATEAGGPTRTRHMERIVSRMRAVSRSLDEGFDVVSHLSGAESGGERLAGYAFLCEHPQPEALEELIGVVTGRENEAFGQYWGIRAMEKVTTHMRQTGVPVPRRVVLSLSAFRDRLDAGTDRYREMSRLMGRLSQA